MHPVFIVKHKFINNLFFYIYFPLNNNTTQVLNQDYTNSVVLKLVWKQNLVVSVELVNIVLNKLTFYGYSYTYYCFGLNLELRK